ncbi:hypothetical protein BS329_37535 [Amycolatopsis coloradensis]|uniref:Uncharacterized protein n=1 Tax=Amycolatopsis coloradensis TaxID=76021 RepID=A0A1R0KFI0_9PSEU|nr:hypothetical protein [Amycolatopsis coloradensis]OLZ44134.1 hypothetical protein BS329_37535 [Amycolatopsis coloradensis]
MNIKRAGVIGVAGLTTAAVGAWTFGAFGGADEPAVAAPSGQVAAAAQKPAGAPKSTVAPVVQNVVPPAVVPVVPAAQAAPVKKVAKVVPASTPKKKVSRPAARPLVVKTAVAKPATTTDSRELRILRLSPRVNVVSGPAAAVPKNLEKITESVDKATGSLDKAEKLIDQANAEVKKAKGEVGKAKGELKKLKSGKHRHHPEKAGKKDDGKRPHVGHVSVSSKGMKPGQTRTVSTSSPDGSSWSSATVTVK